MKHTRHTYLILFLFLVSNAIHAEKTGTSDTLTKNKHFIKPTFYINSFASGKQVFRNSKNSNYRWRQSNIGGFFPIYTNTTFSHQNIQSTFQLIGFGNILTSKPVFSFMNENHVLTRLNIGVNSIYTTGKNTFLFTISPFKAQDRSSLKTSDWRMSWMFIYNYTFNENFSVRLGYIRSFVLDGYPNLPVVGFRLGRYDKVHLNAQFPRNISLTIPLKEHLYINMYGRATGSIYNMRDVEVSGINYSNVVFRRNDFQRGLELTYRKTNTMAYTFGIGTVTGNVKLVEKSSFNLSSNPFTISGGRLRRSGFINIAFQYSFGSSKKVYNNFAMQDAMFLNRLGSHDANPQSNVPEQVNGEDLKLKKVQLKDIEDMIDVDDLN